MTSGPSSPHGTRSAYRRCTAGPNGGKCDDCRRANSGYMLERRHRLPHVPEGQLLVTCWCENRYVLVAPADVKTGRTKSCGAATCREAA